MNKKTSYIYAEKKHYINIYAKKHHTYIHTSTYMKKKHHIHEQNISYGGGGMGAGQGRGGISTTTTYT